MGPAGERIDGGVRASVNLVAVLVHDEIEATGSTVMIPAPLGPSMHSEPRPGSLPLDEVGRLGVLPSGYAVPGTADGTPTQSNGTDGAAAITQCIPLAVSGAQCGGEQTRQWTRSARRAHDTKLP